MWNLWWRSHSWPAGRPGLSNFKHLTNLLTFVQNSGDIWNTTPDQNICSCLSTEVTLKFWHKRLSAFHATPLYCTWWWNSTPNRNWKIWWPNVRVPSHVCKRVLRRMMKHSRPSSWTFGIQFIKTSWSSRSNSETRCYSRTRDWFIANTIIWWAAISEILC